MVLDGASSPKFVSVAAAVCASLIEPPAPKAVERAIADLVDLEALARVASREGGTQGAGETLTPLGVHLSRLPVDVHIGKLILLGAIFNMANDALTIAATLSTRSPFVAPLQRRDAPVATRDHFLPRKMAKTTFSNCLWILRLLFQESVWRN